MIFLTFIFSFLYTILIIIIFLPIYYSKSIIFNLTLTPFDICSKYPNQWHTFKILFIIFQIISSFIVSKFVISKVYPFINKLKKEQPSPTQSSLSILLGKKINNTLIYLNDKSLYQNIFITGTIGSGKTSSAMYPFTKQLIAYCNDNEKEKLGMLILDVKGNYHERVKEFCEKYERSKDLIIIDLSGNFKYNPLHKPDLKASILANRLKNILLLFSENNSDSYWLDKVEQILEYSIKYCRLYNTGYVTFLELHKLINSPEYYKEKINLIRLNFINNNLSNEDIYNTLSCLNFFQNEFECLDPRTLSILKSEVTRITNCFISDYNVLNTFSPDEKELNFSGFTDVVNNGKIVVLNLNISTYQNLSKIIAAYLKLDFQTEVMQRLSKFSENIRPVCFISDEYHEYVTLNDANFFSQSREAKCINIVSTQSYTSLLNALHNESATKVIIQSLVNKLWFRSDDMFTIESAQKQIGKQDKLKTSRTISENSKETNYNYILKSFSSLNSNISESINTYCQFDYIYDSNFFTQKLETFSCLSFLSDGLSILPPEKIVLFPYFKSHD